MRRIWSQSRRRGLACSSEDPEKLAETVLEFSEMTLDQLEAMGRRGQDFYQNNICMKAGVDRFSDLFNRLVGGDKT